MILVMQDETSQFDSHCDERDANLRHVTKEEPIGLGSAQSCLANPASNVLFARISVPSILKLRLLSAKVALLGPLPSLSPFTTDAVSPEKSYCLVFKELQTGTCPGDLCVCSGSSSPPPPIF